MGRSPGPITDVIVAGHTVEQVLSFDVAEAEAVHERSFDDELDKHIQIGMFAMDRISEITSMADSIAI